VGIIYFLALVAIWHVPSFGVDLAFRLHMAFRNSSIQLMLSQEENLKLLYDPQLIKKAIEPSRRGTTKGLKARKNN
jgi:hypothetical protein